MSAQGLLVPADLRRRVEVREVPLTSAALSDLIGGGLLDETMHATFNGHGYVMYVDEARVQRGLPVNERAAILSTRLGAVDQAWMQGLRGDVLVLGADQDGEDQDIPRVVLDLARAAGLLPSLEPRFSARR